MSSDSVLVKAEEGFTTITMNRPERRNALSLGLLRDMTAAFRAAGDSSAGGVILAANGPVFSAGHDFRDLAGADAASIRELLDACTELMVTMQSIPQPVVARVHGLATAAGCQLVATADLAVACRGRRLRHSRRQGRLVLPHTIGSRGAQYLPEAGDGARLDR